MRHPKCPRLVVRLVLLAPSLLLRPVAVPLPAVDAAPLLRQMAGTRSRVNLVQVGACDGDFGEDASSNDPVQGFLLKEPKIHGLLVEANPNVCATLSSKVSGLFDGRVSAVNCAVVPGDSAEDAAFFVVSPRLAAEQPRKAFHWALYQLSSLDRAHVEKHHVHLGLSKQHFARYVEEIRVPCKTPAQLLAEAKWPAAAVDILALDAEGLDQEILRAFLALPGFDPAMVFCEVCHKADVVPTLLAARGYRLARARTEMAEDGLGDLVAWKSAGVGTAM
ncbi:unnamed protein product [Effrenium voratum]|nr:unnamed protein product [Effrenium voratum]